MILSPMLMISVLLTRNAKIASVFLQVMSALSMDMRPNNDKNMKLNHIHDDDEDNFLQVATAIPIHPTQIPSVRSISFANSVNAYSKVRHN